MAESKQDDTLRLVCLIEGKSNVFVARWFSWRLEVFHTQESSDYFKGHRCLQSRVVEGEQRVAMWSCELTFSAQGLQPADLCSAIPENTLANRIRALGDLSEIGDKLASTCCLYKLLSEPWQPSLDNVQIIVKVPPTRESLSKSIRLWTLPWLDSRNWLLRDETTTQRIGWSHNRKKAFGQNCERAPSSLSLSNFNSSLVPVVACNRPFDFDTIPISLLQKEFGLFLDDSSCKVLPSPKSQELLQALTVAACEWHENRTQRRSAFQEVLNDVAQLYLSA